MFISKHILLIDDDADHLSLCKLILERNGYEVMTLYHSERLMETIREFKPDLIFVDHNLKDITGIEITKMIKSHSESKQTPVIYFSSCDDIVIRAESTTILDSLTILGMDDGGELVSHEIRNKVIVTRMTQLKFFI